MLKVLENKNQFIRTALSLLSCAAVFYLQYELQAILPGRFVIIYPTLFFISLIAGFSPAIVSILFCTILTAIFYNKGPLLKDVPELIRLGTFALSSSAIAWLIEYSRKNEELLKLSLQKNAHELSSILEGMKDSFMAIDKDWKIVLVNNNYERMSRTSREDSIGRCLWDVFPQLAHKDSSFWKETHKVMETQVPHEYESYSRLLSTWVEVRIFPKENGIAVFFKDIQKRKMAENDLLLSENHFKQLADSIPHIVWTSNAKGEMDFYNARFYDYTGIEQHTDSPYSIEQSWKSFVHPDDYPRTIGYWNASLVTGKSYHIEYRLLDKKTNSYRWFLGLALPVKDKEDNIIKWFGSCTDIEDQKKLAYAMEDYNSQLQSALFARDEFLSIASHELKTPLTSLKLHTQYFKKLIQKKGDEAYSKERTDSLTQQVEKQVYKLNRLVDDMLDISRIRTGQLTLKPQEFYLSELVSEVQDILKNHFISQNVPTPIIIDNTPQVMVNWDKIRIEQVLINLFTNAIRYGEGKQIILNTDVVDDKILMSLKDHGIGIAEENLDKIFYRFEKIKNPTEVSGLGLGLFISKQIISAHQGVISVESKLGVGSTFKIELPRQINQ